MRVFDDLQTYIKTDKLFEKMNLVGKKLTVKDQQELEMYKKLRDFEEGMKMGLFENNQLNRTKLMAIRQHIEQNKEKFMKKLTYL